MVSRYRIAVIMTWFGKLPDYFPFWLKSAEANDTIDFICICDQEISSDATNIKVICTTMQDEVANYERVLNRRVVMRTPYKFCDCRAFFGILYADLLKGYDFWGYCDIDLVFGDIRKFVTDDVLKSHDRIYQYGHLCLYRNDERTLHLYQLRGGIYSLDEIFTSSAKMTYEEFFGMNRICRMNRIRWYTERDFADFCCWYPKRLEISFDSILHGNQAFFWEDGHAYRAYEEKGKIHKEEFVYMHFQKRKLTVDVNNHEVEMGAFYICPDCIRKKEKKGLPGVEEMQRLNPAMGTWERRWRDCCFQLHRLRLFLGYDGTQQKIKLREKRVQIIDRVLKN